MEEHLICDDFPDNYECWRFHGKSSSSYANSRVEDIDDIHETLNVNFGFANIGDLNKDVIP